MMNTLSAVFKIPYFCILFFLLIAPANVSTRESFTEANLPPTEKLEEAPVMLDGEVLFELRGVSSLPALVRAEAVSERIEKVAADLSFPVSEIKVVEEKEYTVIVAGNIFIIRIINADALHEGLAEKEILAKLYLGTIKSAIERYRFERTSQYLLKQAGIAAGAIALLLLALFGGWQLTKYVQKYIDRRSQKHLTQLEEKSYRILSSDQLRRARRGMISALSTILALILIILCFNFVLSLFPWTRWAAKVIITSLLSPVQIMWTNALETIPGLVFILLLALFIRYIMKLTALFFAGVASGRITLSGFDSKWALPTYKLVRIAIIAFALVIAYPYIPGSESEAFKGISIFFGVLASIGGASIVANNLAGYALIYRKAFALGDRIQIGDVKGDVISMGQQATHLRTLKNEEVTFPSAQIVSSHVVNYSSLAKEKGLILHTTVGISYAVPWRQVEAILLEAAKRTESVLKDPSPFVLIKSLDTFSAVYELNVYSDRPHEMEKQYHALHQNILDVFNEYGVQIMTPAYEGDPEKPKVVPKEKWFSPPFKQ